MAFARFASLFNVAESGNGTIGYTYTRTGSGDYTTTFAGGSDTSFAAGADFDLIFVYATGIPQGGLDVDNTAEPCTSWRIGCYAGAPGSDYEFCIDGVLGVPADAPFTSGTGDWIRYRRVGYTLFVYASNTAGGSWTLIKTLLGWSTGVVYPKLNFNGAASIGPVEFTLDSMITSYSPYAASVGRDTSISIIGSATSWGGGTTWTVTGSASKVSQTINSATSATVVVRPGSTPGKATISDGTFSFDIAVPPRSRKIDAIRLLPEPFNSMQFSASAAEPIVRTVLFDLLANTVVRGVQVAPSGDLAQVAAGAEWRKPRLVLGSNGDVQQTMGMPHKLLVHDGAGSLREALPSESVLP